MGFNRVDVLFFLRLSSILRYSYHVRHNSLQKSRDTVNITQEIENMFRVFIELQKHEWKFGRTRNAVGTRADRGVFPQLFRALPNFHECFYNSMKTWKTFFLFFLENTLRKKLKSLVYFDHQNVNSLCSCHPITSTAADSSVNVKL